MPYIADLTILKSGKLQGVVNVVVPSDNIDVIRRDSLTRAVRRFTTAKKVSDFNGYTIGEIKSIRRVVGL